MFDAEYFSYGEEGKDIFYSSQYELRIAGFNKENIETRTIFSPALTTTKGAESDKFYYSGLDYTEPPEFSFSIIGETPISLYGRNLIMTKLLGQKKFKKLIFTHSNAADPSNGYRYNAIFTKCDPIYVNGLCYGFELTAVLDSWYALDIKPTVIGISINATNTDHESRAGELVYTTAAFDGYIYPKITLTPKNSASATISNFTLNMELGAGKGSITIKDFMLPAGARLVIDCEHKTAICQYTENGTTIEASLGDSLTISSCWPKILADGDKQGVCVINSSIPCHVSFEYTRRFLIGF